MKAQGREMQNWIKGLISVRNRLIIKNRLIKSSSSNYQWMKIDVSNFLQILYLTAVLNISKEFHIKDETNFSYILALVMF